MMDEVYKAVLRECREVLPEAKVYRDNIPQNFQVPAFLVLLTGTEVLRQFGNRQKMTHGLDIQYFPNGEIQEYRQKCEMMKQEMLRRFDVIRADGVSFYVRNRTANVTDDVLHMMCSVSYTEYIPSDAPRMEELKTETGMEG